MMGYELENIATLNTKGIDYICVIWNIAKDDTINRLNNSKLDDKESLWTWTLVQIKHQKK